MNNVKNKITFQANLIAKAKAIWTALLKMERLKAYVPSQIWLYKIIKLEKYKINGLYVLTEKCKYLWLLKFN